MALITSGCVPFRVQRTTTIDGGGSSPVFGCGGGEEMQFSVNDPPKGMEIQVFDEDARSDDLIGESWLTAAIPMENSYSSCKLTRVRRQEHDLVRDEAPEGPMGGQQLVRQRPAKPASGPGVS